MSRWSRLRVERWQALWRRAVQAGRLVCGVPDYDAYVAHVRVAHPGREPMSYRQFFEERQRARYGPGRSRCC